MQVEIPDGQILSELLTPALFSLLVAQAKRNGLSSKDQLNQIVGDHYVTQNKAKKYPWGYA